MSMASTKEARVSTHSDLHSERGALAGEHPGRATNPVIKVIDLAWLEFDRPDLDRTEQFAHAFGLSTVLRTQDELHLRGALPSALCLRIRRAPRSAFTGLAFRAASAADVRRLADATGQPVTRLAESLGGVAVNLVDPAGNRVQVVADVLHSSALPTQVPMIHNSGDQFPRTNGTQRPPRVPAVVERLGHVVLQTTNYRRLLDWYLQHFGLIVSDFKFLPGQRDRGPTMSFIRCDQGSVPSDHHTLAMMLGPTDRYVHSAYQVSDLDALAAGGEHLLEQGYYRSWGIGRHIEGSQIFDYWRDPDGILLEHYTDGDRFDASLETGWSEMTTSGLAQWGPPATADFLGIAPNRPEHRRELLAMLTTFRRNNEFDLRALRGLMEAGRS